MQGAIGHMSYDTCHTSNGRCCCRRTLSSTELYLHDDPFAVVLVNRQLAPPAPVPPLEPSLVPAPTNTITSQMSLLQHDMTYTLVIAPLRARLMRVPLPL